MGDDKLQQLIDLLRRLFGGEESALFFEIPAPREYSRSELQRLRDPAIGGLYYKPEDFSTITGFSGLPPISVNTPAQYKDIFGTERPSMYVPTFVSVNPSRFSGDVFQAVKRAAGYHDTDRLHRAMSQFLAKDPYSAFQEPTHRSVRANLIALDAARGALNFDEVDALEKSIEFTNQLKTPTQLLESIPYFLNLDRERLAALEAGNYKSIGVDDYTPEEINDLKSSLIGTIANNENRMVGYKTQIDQLNQAISSYQPTIAAIKPEAVYSTKPLFEYLAPKPAAPTDKLYRGGIAALRR